jgi:hypothetical protein
MKVSDKYYSNLDFIFFRRIENMNKPFYGVATMPKSERCIPSLNQLKSSTTSRSLDQAPMTTARKDSTTSCPSGGKPLFIQPQEKT